MLRIYFLAMLLLVLAGIVGAISATSPLGLGLGLVILSVGAGGVSAGVMARDTKSTPTELVDR